MIRKLIAIILSYLLLVQPVFATTYYACQNAQNIDGDSTWCTSAHRTGSCAGDGTYTAWSSITSSDILSANGCSSIVIPNTSTQTFTLSKLTNKTDGTGTDGGKFTYATAATYYVTVDADLETGATTGSVLTVTGSSGAGFRLGQNKIINITGGSASSMYGFACSASGVGNNLYIGTATYPAVITGGTNATAHGVYLSGSTLNSTVYATSTGVNGTGIAANGGTINYTGDCIGSNTSYAGSGCSGVSSSMTFTVIGKNIAGTQGSGIYGHILFSPAATDYALFPKDASYTRGTIDEHAVEMPMDPGETNVRSGTNYGSFTGTLDTASGGGSPYAY